MARIGAPFGSQVELAPEGRFTLRWG
jgi:hypothetical protein